MRVETHPLNRGTTDATVLGTKPHDHHDAHPRKTPVTSLRRSRVSHSQIEKFRMMRAFWLTDHGIVRKLLPNTYDIDAEMIRGGHPDRARLHKLKARGVKAILNLRGDFDTVSNTLEKQVCAELGLQLAFVPLRATAAPEVAPLLQTIACLRDLPRPFFVHCKSGADRTALAVVLYLVVIKGVDIGTARRQAFKLKYGHIRWSKARILHRFLDAYEAAAKRGPITLEDWIASEYHPDLLRADG